MTHIFMRMICVAFTLLLKSILSHCRQGSTGVPCGYVRDLGVSYQRQGNRCYVTGSTNRDTLRTMSDIMGGGVVRTSSAYGGSRGGGGRSRAYGYASGGMYSGGGGRFPSYGHRHLLQDIVGEFLKEESKCPIEMSDLKNELELLVEPCSVNATDDQQKIDLFCSECVRTSQFILASNYHTSKVQGTHTFEVMDDEIEEVSRMCGKNLLYYLSNDLGLPIDDHLVVNIMRCQSFHKDKRCPISTEELVNNELAATLQTCSDYLTEQYVTTNATDSTTMLDRAVERIMNGIRAMFPGRSNDANVIKESDALEPDYTLSIDNPEYCSKCYFPFYKVMTTETLSKRFWCKHGKQVKRDPDSVTVDSFHVDMMNDEQFMSCLMNVLYNLEFHETEQMNPFGGDNLAAMMTDVCWQPDNLPNISWHSTDIWESLVTNENC